MQKKYNPKKIEKFVQYFWKKNKTFKAIKDKNKKKYYCLSMFPYPSGKLHMGHVRNYTIGDVISRYQRMLGKNVLQPIGWDAFGLPAENAAIKNKINPHSWTYKNINYMKNQLKKLGFSYDWSREITTCEPEYYRWEQWFFTKIYEKGLAYKKKTLVNWCPNDLTVLANEQVINKKCWRCDTKIEIKKMSQWFIKITKYAEELIKDLNKLPHWPNKVKTMQKNWIGKTKGINVLFKLYKKNKTISVYTTNPEKIMGVTYLSISVNDPLTKKLAKKNKNIKKFIKKWITLKINKKNLKKLKKEGIPTNIHAIHPISNKKIPIWIVNFMLLESEESKKMCIPGHNKNDFEFAKKYQLPIKKVIYEKIKNEYQLKNKKILINSNEFNKLEINKAKKVIQKKLLENGFAKKITKYKLRDWSVSRQRYWGTPIPMIKINKNIFIPIPEKKLPFQIHEKKDKNQQIKSKTIKINGNTGKLETDTFDTFIESSWYYARYTSPKYKKGMIKSSSANYWLPIDQYIGGIEHSTMHLLYFRFFHKLMRDFGLVKYDEPAKKLLCQGMVLSKTFYYLDKNLKKTWISEKKIIKKKDTKNNTINLIDKNGNKVFFGGIKKMSKLKNNGINPETIIKKYGADTLRLFIMFAAPPQNSLEWKESGIKGAHRFINKLWNMVIKYIKNQKKIKNFQKKNYEEKKKLRNELNLTIFKVNQEISKRYNFNTAIAAIMKFFNKLNNFFSKKYNEKKIIQESLETIIKMLSPFIPHVCFIIWKMLGHKKNIDYVSWPILKKTSISPVRKKIIIQINGKKRKEINIKNLSSKKQIIMIAMKDKKIKKYIEDKKIKKIFYIHKKILNFVI